MNTKTLALVLAASTLALSGVAAADVATKDAPEFRTVEIPKRDCPQEGSMLQCFWDAGWEGDGSGHSFWTKNNADGDLCIRYLDYRIVAYCIPDPKRRYDADVIDGGQR